MLGASTHGVPYRESSVVNHEMRLRLHVLPYLGALRVSALTRGVLVGWLEELEAETTTTTGRLPLDSLRPVLRRLPGRTPRALPRQRATAGTA